MSREICVRPCPPPTKISITIPLMGGAMAAQAGLDLTIGCSGCELAANLLLQLNPILGSLGIPICILGCVAAVIGAVQAVPGSLGPPPDPTALVEAIENMVTKCDCLLQFALPPPAGAICDFLKFIRDIIALLDVIITCAVDLVTHLITLNLSAALKLGDSNDNVKKAGQCLADQTQGLMDAFGQKMITLQDLFNIIIPIIDLLKVVVPPPFEDVMSDLSDGMAIFTGSISVGVPPGDFLDSLNALKTAVDTANTAMQSIVSVCPP